MIKKVNVYPSVPIFTVRPAILYPVMEVELGVGDIQNCIVARATVDEILSDGTTLRLDLSNFNKINEVVVETVVEEVVEQTATIEEVIKIEEEVEHVTEPEEEEVAEELEVDSFEELPSKNNYKEKKKPHRNK
ncbi:MAG: hypothetical protein ACRDD7_16715 [Peptostreptococcaceae bacterium]